MAGLVEFAAHQNPRGQSPVQSAVSNPSELPYLPAGQGTDKALVEPAGHQKPGWQGPLHEACTMPTSSPYKPARHRRQVAELLAFLALL